MHKSTSAWRSDFGGGHSFLLAYSRVGGRIRYREEWWSLSIYNSAVPVSVDNVRRISLMHSSSNRSTLQVDKPSGNTERRARTSLARGSARMRGLASDRSKQSSRFMSLSLNS